MISWLILVANKFNPFVTIISRPPNFCQEIRNVVFSEYAVFIIFIPLQLKAIP